MKPEEEPEEEEDNNSSTSQEGDRQGDCLDGIDNDDNGFTDCEDQGCVDKPACQEDHTTVDTSDPEDTGDEDPIDTGDIDTNPSSENPNNGECGDGIDNDSDGATDCDDSDCANAAACDETVTSTGLVIQLIWAEAGDDLDLHLLAPNGTINTETDCYYENCTIGAWSSLDWGVQGDTSDDPILTLDDINGTGPEEIQLPSPQIDGTYTIVVHDYAGSSTDVTGENVATVMVYWNGNQIWTGNKTITGEDTYTEFASIDWSTQTITEL